MSILNVFDETLHGPWKTAGLDVQYKLDHRGVLTFQYTTSVSDWLYNFQFWATPYRNMPRKWYAHRGFVALYKSVRDELTPLYKYGLITRIQGFSQGAALAQLAIEDYYFQTGKPIESAYCFGCPKVFLNLPEENKRAFDNTYLINTLGDIVSMVPPWYKHYFSALIQLPGHAYPSFKDHYPDVYREGLKQDWGE